VKGENHPPLSRVPNGKWTLSIRLASPMRFIASLTYARVAASAPRQQRQ
jgi:hypothetical protein